MTRPKRNSPILEMARERLAGLKQITPAPDLGSALKAGTYEQEINGYSDKQDKYNGEVAALDDTQNALAAAEQVLRDWNQRILAAILAHYGPDSSEVELVGGTRRSEFKKRTRKGSTRASKTTPLAA